MPLGSGGIYGESLAGSEANPIEREGVLQMADNIDTSNGRDNIAFIGSRGDIWHSKGQQMRPGMTVDEWRVGAGLNYEGVKVPAFASINGAMVPVEGRYFIARNDTWSILSQGAAASTETVEAVTAIEAPTVAAAPKRAQRPSDGQGGALVPKPVPMPIVPPTPTRVALEW
jgi:hypothetical protein